MYFPRLVIAGTQSGVGKTTVSLALMAAFARRGMRVQPFKVGPDYIDPSLHHRATGRISCNLDAWLMRENEIKALFCRRGLRHEAPACDSRADASGISIIEGVMGLYDGQASSTFASTAHVAALLEAPVVLVVNAKGMSLSAAALVSGYQAFAAGYGPGDAARPDLGGMSIAGVLLNGVSSERHYSILKTCIEENTGIPCLGYMARGAAPTLPERHLGLVPAGELAELDRFFEQLADMAGQCFDLEAIIDLADNAPELEPPAGKRLAPLDEGFSSLHIGVPRDAAFSFYYPENLELLEEMGAKLVYFSPLRDSFLPPNLDGLYMGGGFPEVFAEELEKNISFRSSLSGSLERGLPAYAECGAMLYLCTSIRIGHGHGLPPFYARSVGDDKSAFAMAGFFSERAEMTGRLQPFGYVNVTLLRDCVLGGEGTMYRAHEFHYARLEEGPYEPLFRIEKDDGRSWKGGMGRKNVAAGFPHLHFYGCPEIAAAFLASCLRRKKTLEYRK